MEAIGSSLRQVQRILGLATDIHINRGLLLIGGVALARVVCFV